MRYWTLTVQFRYRMTILDDGIGSRGHGGEEDPVFAGIYMAL